jgi:hypothetical protein
MNDCDGCAYLIEESDTGNQCCEHDYDVDGLCIDNECYVTEQNLKDEAKYGDCDYY